jgi:hypothetical protein
MNTLMPNNLHFRPKLRVNAPNAAAATKNPIACGQQRKTNNVRQQLLREKMRVLAVRFTFA